VYSIVAVKQAVETKEAGTVATPPASDVAVAEAAGGGEGRLWEGRAGGLSVGNRERCAWCPGAG
jgi:hypothetical protein